MHERRVGARGRHRGQRAAEQHPERGQRARELRAAREPPREPEGRAPRPTAAATRTSVDPQPRRGVAERRRAARRRRPGSGLNAGPSAVLSVPPATSRPHSSQAHGSYEGTAATTSVLATASPAAMSAARFTAGS